MHKIGSGKHKISNQQTIHTIFLLFYACFIADGNVLIAEFIYLLI
jgi:hypothetical protein